MLTKSMTVVERNKSELKLLPQTVAKEAAADASSVAVVSPDTPDVFQAMMHLRQDVDSAV